MSNSKPEDTNESKTNDATAEGSIEFVSGDDFRAVDCEAPIAGSKKIDCMSLGRLFGEAAQAENGAGNEKEKKVYRLLQHIAQIHFKPHDDAEPYGPHAVMDVHRTIVPDDLKGEQSEALAEIVASFHNPGLRARLSDIVWLNDRKLAPLGQLAISSYCDAVELVLKGEAEFYFEDQSASSHSGAEMLRRACQIAMTTGWKEPEGSELKKLIEKIAKNAFDMKDCGGFLNIGELCLDYRIGEPITIAERAESLSSTEELEPYTLRLLWECAARGFRRAEQAEESNRCLINAAECYVAMAAAAGFKGMVAVSWLMDAIKALRQIPNTKERRAELEAVLRDAQASIADEMGLVSTEIDLTEIAKHARKAVGGLTLAQAFSEFAKLEISPDPEALRDEARDLAEKHPLSSIIPMSLHDEEGKVVAQSPGLASGEDGEEIAMRHLIARHESMRRQLVASGSIEPARRLISTEHPLEPRYFHPIAYMSPFIRGGREDLFALGFARFFNGDFISALHILMPQIENSLRYVLKQSGIDTSGIKSDMTQENRTISVMLDKDREALEKIFGPAIVFEIDNLFDFRGGPALRHQIAHGLISADSFYGSDAIYACWFIFRLCCIPLFPYWEQVADALRD